MKEGQKWRKWAECTYHHNEPEGCQGYDTDPKCVHLEFPHRVSMKHQHENLPITMPITKYKMTPQKL